MRMIIAVDFDGTIVENRYPDIGKEIPFATETLRMLIHDGHQLILWTVREGKYLDEAVDWCFIHGVSFYAINKNYPEEKVHYQYGYYKKIYADYFIDDCNIGGLPDWGLIYHIVNQHVTLNNTCFYYNSIKPTIPKKLSWWKRLFI